MKTSGGNIIITEPQFIKRVNAVRTRHYRRVSEEDGCRMEQALFEKYMGTAFFTQGNFTCALICLKNGGHAVGMTKRNGKDHNKPTFARMQALSRAIDYALKSVFYELNIKLLPKVKAEVPVVKTSGDTFDGAGLIKDMLKTPGFAAKRPEESEPVAETPKVLVTSAPVQDIPRTMEDVAKAFLLIPVGHGG